MLARRLGELAAIDFGIQLAGWGVASYLHTERFYDLLGSLTYWAMTLRARTFAQQQLPDAGDTAGSTGLSLRQQVCSLCVLAWSARLGSFLAVRAWKHGDSRFDKVKHHPKVFFIYWMIQGVWCFLTALPVYLSLAQPRRDTAAIGPIDIVSWAGWLGGFCLEVTADRQKTAWKDAGNKGFIHTGVWRYSQHPNYFGEMMLWASLCASCVNSLGKSWALKLASLASPAFVCFLLRYVSGVPLLQKAAKQKYGSDPQFLDYIARTSLLLPWPPRA